MFADGKALVQRLEQQLELYTYNHDKAMSAPALAQMLSVILYGKRFFPYYVWNTLGGLDEHGAGAVFSYDPVGNYEKHLYNCSGSAGHLIQPFLDSRVSLLENICFFFLGIHTYLTTRLDENTRTSLAKASSSPSTKS